MAESGSRAVARYRQSRPWRTSAPQLSVAPLAPHRAVGEASLLAIDLLNPVPTAIIDRERLSWAIGFGFVVGDVGLLGRPRRPHAPARDAGRAARRPRAMARSFDGSASGLARIRSFAQRAVATDAERMHTAGAR